MPAKLLQVSINFSNCRVRQSYHVLCGVLTNTHLLSWFELLHGPVVVAISNAECQYFIEKYEIC